MAVKNELNGKIFCFNRLIVLSNCKIRSFYLVDL